MKFLIITIVASLALPFAQAATQYQFQPDAGKVVFKTKGWPNLVTIKGEGKGVAGNLSEDTGKVSGEITFQLAQLKTGIELRDNHMKDTYLEVKKHPVAKIKLTNLEVPKDLDGSFEFKGMMTLHGVEKQVSGQAELENDSGKLKLIAEIPIKLSDFKIAIPSYQGITVAEKVNISISSEVKKQQL